jgi:FkbM family methyltransferase
MRKVFIDCGAHIGGSLEHFFNNFEDAQEYDLYSFEANPNFHQIFKKGVAWEKIPNFNADKFTYMPKAVWVEDGDITLYQRTKFISESSTLSEEKYNARKHQGFNQVKVECVDFSSWLKDNFTKDDYIVLKMDIEGAEYEVIDKMYEDGTLGYVNEFYGELHNIKCGKFIEDDKKIIDNLSEHDLTLYYWEAGPDEEGYGLKERVYDDEYVNDIDYPAF